MLVNGVRISSFREIRSYPPEAIQKVEVFPEEVAQRYGYSPDQRVVNIILKRNFSSREVEVEYGQPWEGGLLDQRDRGDLPAAARPGAAQLQPQPDDTSLLTEAERGVDPVEPADLPDRSRSGRVPQPDQRLRRIEGTANFTTRLGSGGSSLSLNAPSSANDSLRYQGLDSVVLTAPGGAPRAHVQRGRPADGRLAHDTFSLGTTLNTSLGDWQITGTADGSLAKSRSDSERFADTSALQAAAAAGTLPIDADLPDLPDAGFDRAESRNTSSMRS
jgi:hypothetical protein